MRYDFDMAETANPLMEVACPCCGATLRIDIETRAVIQHREPEKKPLIEDLHAAVQQLKGEEGRRNEMFEKSFASHRSADKVQRRNSRSC